MKLSPLLFICVLLAMLPACRTSPPPEFHGRWRAVNRFPAETRAIPLRPDTVFAATPLNCFEAGAFNRRVHVPVAVADSQALPLPAAEYPTATTAVPSVAKLKTWNSLPAPADSRLVNAVRFVVE